MLAMAARRVSWTWKERVLIRIPLSGPEESSEAIFSVTRHQVNVEMGDALADSVVNPHKGAFGMEALLDGLFEQLHGLKQGSNPDCWKVGQRFIMGLGDAEAVQWLVVQKARETSFSKSV